jgi:hypothetical protein
MKAYPLLGHDRFILYQLAFELPDADECLGFAGFAVINGGFRGLGGTRRECSDGGVLRGNRVFQPSPRFPASI